MADFILNYLFAIIIGAYLIRMIFNWILLNMLEEKNYPKLFSLNPNDLFLTFRHLTISALKPWWTGEPYRKMKSVSNFISLVLYLGLAGIILTFVIAYKL